MCLHLNQGLNNDYEPVCYECGLILGSPLPILNQNEISKSLYNCEESNEEIRTFLLDCCDRMHIPEAIINSILTVFNSLRQKSVFKKINDQNLMAYAIYFKLKDADIGRDIEYIASKTGVLSKDIWRCESIDPCIPIPLGISNLLLPHHLFFELNIEDCNNIIKISKHFQERHFSPLTMVSTLIYLYCKAKKIPISMKKICLIHNISAMSIYRCQSYITKEKFNSILETSVE